MTNELINRIYIHLREKVYKKLEGYDPETQAKPFHVALLGEEHAAVHSFVHSVYTMLGMGVFEQIAVMIAASNYDFAERQYSLIGQLSDAAIVEINDLLEDLSHGRRKANVDAEDTLMREVAKRGEMREFASQVDVYCERDNRRFCFELKSVKPNIGIFKETKEKMLKWKAAHYSSAENEMHTFCALPYNPEAPKKYDRYTIRGVMDTQNELLVQEHFWELLGGEGSYIQLIGIFEKVGIESREQLNQIIKGLNRGRK